MIVEPLVALIGMPGGGKSTVGRHLARHLDWRFVDSDTELERRLGRSIASYFAEQGEEAFRDAEQQVIAAACREHSGEGLVLATGGGAVLREANRQVLHRHAAVVYLRSSPEELIRRLRHDTQRPLLQVGDPTRALREMFQQRDPLYRATAHYVIDTGRPSVATLVNMIVMQLELAGVLDPHRSARGP